MTKRTLAVGISAIVCLLVLGFASMHFRAGAGAGTAAMNDRAADTAGTTTPDTPYIGNGLRQYQNAAYHFSLTFPSSFTVIEYREANGALSVVFSNSDGTQSFDVYVTPYDKQQIDQARFKLDEPSGIYNDPQSVVIDGVTATMFFGHDATLGDTREVWFIHNGYLYEVATYKNLDAWLAGIMQSWQFI